MTTDGHRQIWPLSRQIGPLALVMLLHVAFFYALQSGLGKQALQPEPREIIATLIAAQPAPVPVPAAPQPPRPQPEPPKPKVMPTPPKPAPSVAVAKPAPSAQPTPKSITAQAEPVPTAAPAAAEPATSTPPASTAAAAQAAPSAPVQPRTITTGVEYLQAPRPEYPALSRRMGEEGTVMLRILINDKGRAERADIHKSSGMPRLDESARQAAMRAVFKPYTENGRPVPVYAILPISFQLDN